MRRGNLIAEVKAWTYNDPRGALVESLTPYKGQLKYVNVDSAGIGYGMAQHLKDFGFPIREVNVGSAPRKKERFANLKAELYWGFLERVKAGDLAGLTDEKTIAQLASIRYELTSRGQVAIEKKENALKRGVKSPDRADAVILAFAGILIEGAGLIEYYENLTKQFSE